MSWSYTPRLLDPALWRSAAAVLAAIALVACSGKSPSAPTPSEPPSASPPATPPPAAPPTYDVDTLGVPAFAANDYIDLAGIQRISRFRSAAGHDAADEFETCRSMKHYFQPKFSVDATTIAVFSPVAGTVFTTREERTFGLQVVIQSSAQPAFTFIIFHLNPSLNLTAGTTLTAGQRLGNHIGSQTSSDIAVVVDTPRGRKAVSWFQVMTDGVFQGYAARGVASRASAIITQAERDADPLTCNGETFTSTGSGAIPDWLVLR
jgi:hypothetical protein